MIENARFFIENGHFRFVFGCLQLANSATFEPVLRSEHDTALPVAGNFTTIPPPCIQRLISPCASPAKSECKSLHSAGSSTFGDRRNIPLSESCCPQAPVPTPNLVGVCSHRFQRFTRRAGDLDGVHCELATRSSFPFVLLFTLESSTGLFDPVCRWMRRDSFQFLTRLARSMSQRRSG
jgi:hypothetical protein